MHVYKKQILIILAIVAPNGFTFAQEENVFTNNKIDPGKIYRWEETKQVIEDIAYTAHIVFDTFLVKSITIERDIYIYILRRYDDTLGYHFLTFDNVPIPISSEYQVVSACEETKPCSCVINVGDILVMTLVPYLPDNIAGGSFFYNLEVGNKSSRILPTRILAGYNIYHSQNICGMYYLLSK